MTVLGDLMFRVVVKCGGKLILDRVIDTKTVWGAFGKVVEEFDVNWLLDWNMAEFDEIYYSVNVDSEGRCWLVIIEQM